MFKAILLLSLLALATCALVGGFVNRGENEEDVLVAANHAAKSLSKIFASKNHHKLGKVIKAESQVVAGVNYRLSIIVGETSCKKAEVAFEDTASCDFKDNISTYKKCTVVVYRDLNGSHKLVSSGCILASKKDL